MSDYAYLVKRLRGKKLNCICAAKSASECCCNTDWPESSCNEAAAAIEVLQNLVERYESEKDVHEYEQKNLWACVEAQGKRIEELEAALKPFADASDLHLGSDDMSIAFRIIIGNLRQARKVLGEEE